MLAFVYPNNDLIMGLEQPCVVMLAASAANRLFQVGTEQAYGNCCISANERRKRAFVFDVGFLCVHSVKDLQGRSWALQRVYRGSCRLRRKKKTADLHRLNLSKKVALCGLFCYLEYR